MPSEPATASTPPSPARTRQAPVARARRGTPAMPFRPEPAAVAALQGSSEDILAQTQAVRAGGAERDAVEDMRWALAMQPPDFLALVSLVQRAGAPVLGVVEEQSLRTPLHVAALYGKVAYAAMLINRGACIEATDSSEWTPLMSSAFGEIHSPIGGIAVTKLLLSHGANVHAVCKMGSQSLHVAASYGTVDMLALLLDHGADVNARDMLEETPLHKAALRGDLAVGRFLVGRGADRGARAKCGSTPAEMAAAEEGDGHAALARLLSSLSS